MEISKEDFTAYEKVRQSGVTNMFDVEMVTQLSGLSRAKCFEIMRTYADLMKRWPGVREHKYPRTIGIVNLEGF